MLYLDCQSGLAGDMLCAALADAGADADGAVEMLSAVADVRFQKIIKDGVDATRMRVRFEPQSRQVTDLKHTLTTLPLTPRQQAAAQAVVDVLAAAESHAHQTPVEDVHLHEAADIIVDAAAAAWLLDDLGLLGGSITASPLAVGEVAPATRFILDTHRIPTVCRGTAELTTPTGAALAATLVTTYSTARPPGTASYGAGSMKLPWPNVACAIRGEGLSLLETNVDDVTGEELAYASKRLLAEGAVDVSVHPCVMKKGRPAHCVRVLTADPSRHARVMWAELGTLGVRQLPVSARYVQDRGIHEVDVPVADAVESIAVKSSNFNVKAEYDDVAAAAERHGVPFREVRECSRRMHKDSTAGLKRK